MTEVKLDFDAARDLADRVRRVGDELTEIAPSVEMAVWGNVSLACAAVAVAEACARVARKAAQELSQLASDALEASGFFEAMDGRLEEQIAGGIGGFLA